MTTLQQSQQVAEQATQSRQHIAKRADRCLRFATSACVFHRRGILQKTVGHVYAVDDVSFTLGAGEALGLVGESGSGKTTIGRSIVRLQPPSAGEILSKVKIY